MEITRAGCLALVIAVLGPTQPAGATTWGTLTAYRDVTPRAQANSDFHSSRISGTLRPSPARDASLTSGAVVAAVEKVVALHAVPVVPVQKKVTGGDMTADIAAGSVTIRGGDGVTITSPTGEQVGIGLPKTASSTDGVVAHGDIVAYANPEARGCRHTDAGRWRSARHGYTA